MRNNQKIVILLAAAAALGAAVAVVRSHKQAAPAPNATTLGTPSASASGSASASAATKPLAPWLAGLAFEFECNGIVPDASETCGTAPEPARKLLEVTAWYRVSAMPCSGAFSKQLIESTSNALRAANALDVAKLPPLLRAELQGAALKVLSCAKDAEPADSTKKLAEQAQAFAKKLTLSSAERAALPESAESLKGWFGGADLAAVSRSAARSVLHSQGEGFAYAYTQAQGSDFVLNFGRMVLLDEQGKATISDVVYRALARRIRDGKVQVCIAEADASCPSGRLRPISSELGTRILHGIPGSGAIGCDKCHINSETHGKPYGPELGIALPESTAAKVNERFGSLF